MMNKKTLVSFSIVIYIPHKTFKLRYFEGLDFCLEHRSQKPNISTFKN